jgi:deoxyxylulose-5-phosphate synthase
MDYQYLPKIESPADLKKVPREELPKVADALHL